MFLSHCITTSHFRIVYPVGVQLEHGICRKYCLRGYLTNSLISESKFSARNLRLSFSLFLSLLLSLLSHQVVSDSSRPHGLQHARLPCPLPSPGVYPSSCILHQWCQPTISFSVTLFSFCLQPFLASGSFPTSRLFPSGDTGVVASVSVLPMNIQGWFPLGLTGLISLLSKGLSRVFSSTTVQKHQFSIAQLPLWFNS